MTFGPPPQLLPEHFGPSFPEEVLYFEKRITYEDCKRLCELHRDSSQPPPRDEQIRNIAYSIWERNGGDEKENWYEAELAVVKYELTIKPMIMTFDDMVYSLEEHWD